MLSYLLTVTNFGITFREYTLSLKKDRRDLYPPSWRCMPIVLYEIRGLEKRTSKWDYG
jgi:hypothetical protein